MKNLNSDDKKDRLQQQQRTKQGKSHRDDSQGHCEIFPSYIDIPVNKIIAPCW